jgi:hypothetical protein
MYIALPRLCASINKNKRMGIDIDNINCNICEMPVELPDLEQHIVSQIHLRNKAQLDTKLRILNTVGPRQQSVLHKWLESA